jgi:hypothetical protein
MSDFRKEAEVFGKYLLGGKLPSEKAIELYLEAMQLRPAKPIGKDEKILRFVLKHPSFTGLFDSALAFSGKKSILRRKILFMSAILETQPAYADLFLPKESGWFYHIYIFWVGCRAILKMLAGKFLLLFF